MSTLDSKMNSDPQCNTGTGEVTGLCKCNCRCQNHQQAFAAKKAGIMADFVSDCSFLLEKGDVRMLLPGGQYTGKCSITYPSHPGLVLFTTMVNGKKEGSGLLENHQGCSIAECFFRNDMLEGSFTCRTPEGVLVQTECYVNGKREGVVQKFDADGNRTEMVRCSNGGEVSVLHPLSSLEGYWEERSKATNEILSVAKYTADFSAMDGLCFIYEQGRVKRGEWYGGGRMERVMVEFDEKVRTEFGEGGEKCFVGEYRNDVASGFCREGKGCVLEGGVVVKVNVYANGEEVRRWKMLVDEVMTEMDEKGVVVYVGEYAENPELFCPRNGKGRVFENGELKCVGVFEGDAMKRKEREFEKGFMIEYDDEEKMAYWGGYVKNEKGVLLRDG